MVEGRCGKDQRRKADAGILLFFVGGERREEAGEGEREGKRRAGVFFVAQLVEVIVSVFDCYVNFFLDSGASPKRPLTRPTRRGGHRHCQQCQRRRRRRRAIVFIFIVVFISPPFPPPPSLFRRRSILRGGRRGT